MSDGHRPFPRKPLPVTELVTPLKPLEAMAMEKAVVTSSVAAMAEMVEDGVTGWSSPRETRKPSPPRWRAFCRTPICAARALGTNARDFVKAEPTWAKMGERVREAVGE